MFKYPYTNFHELNLDWLIQKIESGELSDCAFVRPEDFPDSINPIQEAMDQARDNNKIVLLSTSYYIRDNNLRIHDGTMVIGIYNAEIISTATEFYGFVPYSVEVGNNCTIRGVKFNGNRPDGPSQSLIPSQMDGHAFATAPLILLENVSNVTFQDCYFVLYDSNRSTSTASYRYAVIGAHGSRMITIDHCRMENCLREGWVFSNCEKITIKDCWISMGGEDGTVYTEIGIGRSNNVEISGCRIQKADDVTTSVINAMGDDIKIHDCTIIAPSSNYGIDYGNEIAQDFTADGLLIQNNYLNCHIGAATTFPVVHDNVVISNNIIIGTGLLTQSAIVYIYGEQGVHITLQGNHFAGPISAPIVRAVRFQFTDASVDLLDNLFEIPGLYLTGHITGTTLIGNVFKASAMYQAVVGDNPEELTMIACRTEGVIGTAVSNNNISLVCIGCDLKNTSFTNTTVDYSRSYVRP